MMAAPGCSSARSLCHRPHGPVAPLPAESSAPYVYTILETEHRSAAAEVVLAAPARRAWVAPAIVEMGGMRQLTLLQGPSVLGGCDLTGSDPSCGF